MGKWKTQPPKRGARQRRSKGSWFESRSFRKFGVASVVGNQSVCKTDALEDKRFDSSQPHSENVMWIQVVAGEDWAAQEIAEKHGYIVDKRYRPLTMGSGFGEVEPAFCLKVEKGGNIIESEDISERPDLEGQDFSWLLITGE